MSAAPAELAALHERAAVLADLGHIHALLFWDQNTMMPPRGAAGRGDQAATLEAVAHERLTDPELGRLLDALEPWAAEQDPDADDVRLVPELRRDFEKAVRVPTSLAAEIEPRRRARPGRLAGGARRGGLLALPRRARAPRRAAPPLRRLLHGLRASLRRAARRLRAAA